MAASMLIPLNDVELLEDAHNVSVWQMTGNDPAFLLSTPPLKVGLYRLDITLSEDSETLRLPRLYIDSGRGFNEEESIELGFIAIRANRYVASVYMPSEVRALRFDPSVMPGRLAISTVKFSRISPRLNDSLMAAELLRRRMTDLRRLSAAMKRAVRTFATGGVTAVIADIRRAYRVLEINEVDARLRSGSEPTADAGISFGQYDSEYQPEADFSGLTTDIKAIAFHLPQFHPCAQNDEWWGAGFTEWVNTRKAKPRFPEHYQPREPHPDIGYYDLRDVDALRKQAELARRHGIHGFCYYHYWFSGERILEKPVDTILSNKDVDVNFCLCWANENWTRTWDGLNSNVLLEQKYLPEDPENFIDDIAPYLQDHRYIRVDGKPVIVVYKPQVIPDVGRVFEVWRRRWREKAGEELEIWCARTDFEDTSFGKLLEKAPFEAAVEFPPHVVPYYVDQRDLGLETDGHFYNYRKFVSDIRNGTEITDTPRIDFYRSVMLGWDNSARRATGWSLWYGFSLKVYYGWLRHVIEHTRRRFAPDRRFVFVNAWNEWAEGTYLEPDARCGYASINTTSRALFDLPLQGEVPEVVSVDDAESGTTQTVAVHVHVYFDDLIDEFAHYLGNVPVEFDLFVTTDTEPKAGRIRAAFGTLEHAGRLEVLVVPNKGRDLAPFLVSFGKKLLAYDLIGHFHTKKSETVDWGDRWRRYLLDNLLGSVDCVEAILRRFGRDPRLGLVFPPTYPLIAPYADWAGLSERCADLLERLECGSMLPDTPRFPAGSMFWARSAALAPILRHEWAYDDFEEEQGQLGNTLSHCLERVWQYVASHQGYETVEALSREKPKGVALSTRRLVIFAHYDPQSVVSAADLNLVAALSKVSDEIIFVSNSNLTSAQLDEVKVYCSDVVTRDNVGFDFAAWRDGINRLGLEKVRDYDELILMNNSVYGPVFPLEEILSTMNSRNCDFWGVSAFPEEKNSARAEASYLDDNDIPGHLQSYFLLFKRDVVRSAEFSKFWQEVRDHVDMLRVIADYEVQLTRRLVGSGFKCETYVPESAIMQARHRGDVLYNSVYSEPMSFLLLRSPFVKKKVAKYAAEETPRVQALVHALRYYPRELLPLRF